MRECTKHRDLVVRYGPYHSSCPACKLLEAAKSTMEIASDLWYSDGSVVNEFHEAVEAAVALPKTIETALRPY